MDRARAWLSDAALEAAQIRALLDIGLPEFLAEPVSGAGFGFGLRDVVGVDPRFGCGGERDEQLSQKGGRGTN